MNARITLLLMVFLALPYILEAQTDDFGIRTSLGVEKKLGKWDLAAEAELRTQENAKQMNRWSLGIEPSLNITKWLKVGAAYEFIYYNDVRYSDYQPRHRGYLFTQGKYEWGRFTFSLRERFQVTKKDDSDRIKNNGNINIYRINPEWTWRNRIKAAYNIPKFPLKPAFSFETFYQLNNTDGNTFNKLRYTLSFSYKLTKHHQFEAYGLLDKDINVTNPGNLYILGVGYNFSF